MDKSPQPAPKPPRPDGVFKGGRFKLTPEQRDARAQRRIAAKGAGYGDLKSLMCCVGGTALDSHRRFAAKKGIPFYIGNADAAKCAAQLLEFKPDGIVGMPAFLAHVAQLNTLVAYRANYVASGGGMLRPEDVKSIRSGLLAAGKPGYGGYGTSETSSLTLITFDEAEKMPNCVGKPCPGVEIEIRDGHIFAKTPDIPAALAGKDGFIDTGDDGYMKDGYLYLEKKSVGVMRAHRANLTDMKARAIKHVADKRAQAKPGAAPA